MKTRSLLAHYLVVPLLLCAWPRTGVAHTTIDYAVVAWGNNEYDQTTVPVAAQSGVTAVAAGYFHTLALKHDGSVLAWGLDNNHQATVPAAAQSGVTAIAAGPYHSVALKQDGTVVAWGYNGNGEVTGTPTPLAPFYTTAHPVTLAGQVLGGVTAIAAGGGYTLALKDDGTVVAWGSNLHGQTTVPAAAQGGVSAIVAGVGHALAMKYDGSVVAWGLNDNHQTTVPAAAQTGVIAIAAGHAHSVALKDDGSVVAWGWNGYGQTTVPLAAQSGVTAIAAGSGHTVALKEDGSVVTWGLDTDGQTTVPAAAKTNVAAIAAGYSQTFALVEPTAPHITTPPAGQAVAVWQRADFTVTATGYPLNYQWRKDGTELAGATNATYRLPFTHPKDAGDYTVIVSNPAGSVTSAPPARLTVNPAAGTVVAWGKDNLGEMPVPISAQSGVTAIATAGGCGFGCYAHTLALKNDGTVLAWGGDFYGQVTGTPTTDSSGNALAIPVTLGGQALGGVTAIAAGPSRSVALRQDGTVVAWGFNGNGQVTGTPTASSPYSAIANPVTLEGVVLSGVKAIAAGLNHTVAVRSDGSVVSWGTQTDVPASATSGVIAIAAGADFTVALKSDGSVVAWGRNDWGQTTVPAAAQSGVTAIAAGYGHAVALRNDGSLVAWGENSNGQVTGTPTPEFPESAVASPVTLGGRILSGVTAIAAGYSHTVALRNDGTLVAWGLSRNGQVTGTPTADESNSAIANPLTLGGEVLSGATAIAAGEHHTVALIGSVPLSPSLKVTPKGHELILSWPTNATGFTLQSTLDLTPPVIWTESTGVPAVVGGYFTLTNDSSGGTRFYRLGKR